MATKAKINKKSGSKPHKFRITRDCFWIYIANYIPVISIDMGNITKKSQKQISKFPLRCSTAGKYLFFSSDKKTLIKLAKKILVKYDLPDAKISTTPGSGSDYVLCVYDLSPRLKYELKQYADEKKVKYRYWKSDADTLAGKYSKKFLESQQSQPE